MAKHIIAALLFLYTIDTFADVKNREKAEFDLISSIEVLVNIDECRKGIQVNDGSSILPRACSTLPRLSKYFFDKNKDKAVIEEYLDSEEAKISKEASVIADTFKIKKLGKMILSSKCVKNSEPVDLDHYLDKIRGIPTINSDEDAAMATKNDLMPLKPELRDIEPRNPATEVNDLEQNF